MPKKAIIEQGDEFDAWASEAAKASLQIRCSHRGGTVPKEALAVELRSLSFALSSIGYDVEVTYDGETSEITS